MNHFIFGVSIAAFVLGVSSGIVALSAHIWGKGDTFKYIGLCAIALAGLVAVCGVVEYAKAAGIVFEPQVEDIGRAITYAFLAFFWYLIARSLYRLMSVRWSEGKRDIHLLIVLLPLLCHIFSIFSGGQARLSLRAVRDFLIKAQALNYAYILFRYRGRVIDSEVTRLWNVCFILIAAFAPLFFIESFFRGIKAFYASMHLVRPSIFFLCTLIILAFFRFTINFIMKPENEELQESEPAFLRERGLTEREIGVIRLLLERLSYREIGQRLFISVPTVKSHVHHAFQKLEVGSREELTEMAEGFKK
jgi:DNA-binding CsgD family transcriptional regulator